MGVIIRKVYNDPIPFVLQAYQNLYPDKVPDLIQLRAFGDDEQGWGLTNFSADGTIQIEINIALPLEHYPEILAHELAHGAAGVDAEHGAEWQKAFDAIQTEFDRLICKHFEGAKM